MIIKRRFLHHVSSFSDFFACEKTPKLHEVILLKLLEKDNLDPLFSLFSETIQKGQDIVFASKDSLCIQEIVKKITMYLKSDEVIPPFSVSELTSSTKKEDIIATKEKNSRSSLCSFSVALKSNIPLKQLESSAKFALDIAKSCYVGITPPPLRLKIVEQLSLVEGRVNNFLKVARTSSKFNEKKSSSLISNIFLALKNCQDAFNVSSDLSNTPVKLTHHLFYVLFVSIMKFLKKMIYLKLDLPTVNFQIFRIEQLMNPALQSIWNSKDHCFILDKSVTSYFLYTDASVLKKSQGSFSGALTLESGHIIKSWNYKLSEVITDANTVELLAIIYALYQVKDMSEKIIVQTDSEIAIETLLNYSIGGKITFHLQNNPLFCEIFSKLPRINNMYIQHVKSHSNCTGNIFVDKAATHAHKHGKTFSWKGWALKILKLGQTQICITTKKHKLLPKKNNAILQESRGFLI